MAVALVPLPQTNLPARLAMNEPNQSVGRLLARSAVELALVTALVFATGWGGVRLAEAVHRHLVTPGRDGTIELPIVKSDRSGNVSFEEGSGYKGWHSICRRYYCVCFYPATKSAWCKPVRRNALTSCICIHPQPILRNEI